MGILQSSKSGVGNKSVRTNELFKFQIFEYSLEDGRCNLCLKEKIKIMMYSDPGNLLNQICDLIARCRHRKKFRL